MQKLEAQLRERDEKLSALLSDKAALGEELKKLREEFAAAKKANSTQLDTHDYSEAETRDYFIDLLLKEAGWTLDKPQDREFEVSGMPNNAGVGFVDYVLWGDDGKPLAVIEAKRTKRDARVGQQQAKLYADCLEAKYGQRPVIFYSNGYEHWLWDDANYPPRGVQGFFKKSELALMIQRRTTRKPLAAAPIDEVIVERYYQTRAIRRIGEVFERDRQRKALVVMATGAGKTRTVIALADLLMRCNWTKRVLFLADRVALVNQAVKAFKSSLPDSSPVNLVTEKNTEGRVYVSTYPTMMGLIDEAKDGQRRFGVGHFDLIVIDEAHRSVYQKYRAIFEYFDSLLVGLTATPKDEIDHNTYGLFDLERGVPTDAYGQKVAGGDRLGKTIVFAKNTEHAEFIATRFNIAYPHYKGEFARVITYKTEYAQSLIDNFSNKNKMPHIAISVDMLDTGIDVPEVVNLVFFKAVHSKTKFWQMVGRGTRLCLNLFGPDVHKEFFYLFDYCQNLEFFSQNPDVTEGAASEPLGVRLFKARLQMIEALDQRKELGDQDEETLGKETVNLLHGQVAAMNIDNFVVRPQRRLVEKYAKSETWLVLGVEEFGELARNIANLPTELADEDEEAKRFDLLVLRTQLSILQAMPGFASLRDKIIAIASALEDQQTIPAIRAHLVLIQSITGEEWWEDVTVAMLETARKRLRALIKLIEKGKRHIVYSDFEDALGEESMIDLPGVGTGMNFERFREKARQFLRAHENHLALQRLRRNQPLTPADLTELERMLVEAGGTKEAIERAKKESHGLGMFIRSLVGLDHETAKQAFGQFISGEAVTANQIEFINLVVDYLTENGVMEPDKLYESPFTDINSQGPEGVFPSAQVVNIVTVLGEIRQMAVG